VQAGADAATIVRAAVDHWRGLSSRSEVEMVVHRPDWERSMILQVWTRGTDDSLVRVESPPKDYGNATLLLGNSMWTYTPKIDRVIKIPSSMMQQSWMGSDFTNNDVARADDLVDEYTHTLKETRTEDGHSVYTIESVPLETAPVPWGREVLRVRDDHILLEHNFFDQDGVLVKKLETSRIRPMGGRLVATIERMQKVDHPGEWTEIRVRDAAFDITIPDETFTLSNLRNPRF